MKSSMDAVRHWLNTKNMLETMKLMGARIYEDDAVFLDEKATLEDCVERSKELWETGNHAEYASLFVREVQDIYEHIGEYGKVEAMLEDERSREILSSLLLFRLTRDDRFLMRAYCPEDRQYFSTRFMRYEPKGVFVDCGALDGATTLEYMTHVPDFTRAYVYEPMEDMYQECVRNFSEYPAERVVVRKRATIDAERVVFFDSYIEGSSHVSDEGTPIQATSIDEDIQERVSMIKMDIEGSEQDAIRGAKRHIAQESPLLAICVYHKPEDLHAIPRMIREINSGYRYILRHHMLDQSETVLYAIPRDATLLTDQQRGLPTLENDIIPKGLTVLLLKEYMRVQKWTLNYMRLLIQKNEGYKEDKQNYSMWLAEAKRMEKYLQTQYQTEKDAHEYFKAQYQAEKDAHEHSKAQYQAEKDAHEYFESQYQSEKDAHEFSEAQYQAEKDAHEYTKAQYQAEKDAHEYSNAQYQAEKDAHEYFEAQYQAEKDAHEYSNAQYQAEKDAHEYFEAQYQAEKDAHEYFETQYQTERDAHEFFQQQYEAAKATRE